jgi:drug/metabolite transporter (DMT)-like permease
MKKAFNLFIAIMMALITTFIILWILYTFEESDLGWGMLILVSITGYLTSALYFYNHKQNTKKIG